MFEYVYPTFKICLAFIRSLLGEQGQLEEYHPDLVRERDAVVLVRQDDVGAKLGAAGGDWALSGQLPRHHEVHEEDSDDGFQLVVPAAAPATLGGHGLGDVVDGAVAEEDLAGVLHLDDYHLALGRLAEDVVDARLVVNRVPVHLLVGEGEIRHLILALEQLVQEVYQKVFVHLLAKYDLEADIRERVDES